MNLESEDQVVIAGLTPFSILPTGVVPVRSSGGNASQFSLFCDDGLWDRDERLLSFAVCKGATLVSSEIHVFKFDIQNPDEGQESPKISVYARNDNGV